MAATSIEQFQTIKRYQLFDVESYEEKAVKRSKGVEIAVDEGPSFECKVKLSSLTSSQGLVVFSDIWYILGTVPPEADPQDLLFIHSKGVTVGALKAHQKNFGIWARECEKSKYVVTLGEDLVEEPGAPVKKGLVPISAKKVPGTVIKIWDPEQLLDGKYLSVDEYDKEDKGEKIIPKTLPLDRIMPLSNVSSMAVSKDLSHIALGLATGSVLVVKAGGKGVSNLVTCSEKDVQYIALNPDPAYALPVTNIHLLESGEKGRTGYTIFGTCEKAFYCYSLTRKGGFSLIANGVGALPGAMDCVEDSIAIFNSSKSELRKYKGTNLEATYLIKEKAKIRLVGKEILFLPVTEKTKAIKVYDMNNEIISYQASVADIYTATVNGNYIYLLVKLGVNKATQILKEKTSIEKLESFLRKRHYDVAYKFAKNEKFSEEVLADISRYYGDFYYGKGMYKEAVERYKNTIGYLNPSYVIQKFLDVQRLENLTDYLETLSKQSLLEEKETMLEEHKYYTALLLNCYVKQGGDKLKNLIISTTFDKSMLDTDTAIEVCKESKQLDCALLLAQKAGNVDQQLRILIEDQKEYKSALDIIDKNMSFDNKLTYLRRFGPQLIKKLPGETYLVIEKVGEQLIQKRNTDQANAAKYTQQFKCLKEIFVDNKELNKKFLDFQVNKDPNCEKEVFHGLIEWHLQDYFNAQRMDEEHKANTGSKLKEDPLIELKKKYLIDLLITHKEKYDKKHVLMLFEMYQVSEGVRILCEMLELKHELMTYYMQNKEYENIVKLCEQYGEREQNLWIQALTYFVSELGDDKGRMDPQKYIKSVLKHLEKILSISPLLVLEITSKNKSLKFSVLKEYLAARLNKLQTKIEKNRKAVTQLTDDIDRLKQNIKTLRTTAQLVHLKDCSECGKKLELPVLHFMCNHSYHDYCVSSSESTMRECPKCSVHAQQILDKKAQLLGQMENHEQFFKELKENDMKFNVVAQYFGRGLFAGLNAAIPEPEEDAKDNF